MYYKQALKHIQRRHKDSGCRHLHFIGDHAFLGFSNLENWGEELEDGIWKVRTLGGQVGENVGVIALPGVQI